MKIDNNLSQIFDVEPIKQGEVITSSGEVVVPEHDTKNEMIDYDYEKSRNNLHGLLIQGQDALNYALEVAKSSEHPRAFEVVGGLIKNISDVNDKLLEVHEKMQKLEGKVTKKEEVKTVTNNSIFLGSTNELSQLLKKMNTGE
jgi:hypothetical protein